jgi:hypothetical protein
MLTSTTPAQLPSPPMTYAESPFKVRLRARKADASISDIHTGMMPRKKISKRAVPPARGINKRRRAEDDDMSRKTEQDDAESEEDDVPPRPSTPKRMRLAPEALPLGLERKDFHALHLQQVVAEGNVLDVEDESGEGGEEWSDEDDRLLVELVLEKLKLTKSEWQDCARSLGKDRGSVGRRWKSLMAVGEVGLKGNGRGRGRERGRICATWR